MAECFICGVDEDHALLFEVITKEGIKKICKECLEDEDFPVIKKPDDSEMENKEVFGAQPHKIPSIKTENAVLEDNKINLSTSTSTSENLGKVLIKQDPKTTIKIEPNLITQDKRDYNNVVDHFHWIIMRKRRLKKLTKEQFAKEVKEPLQIIEIIERGFLPSDYLRIFGKLEKFLETELLKEEARKKLQEKPAYLDFEKRDFNNLTIADLKKMKEERVMQEEKNGSKITFDFGATPQSDKNKLSEENTFDKEKKQKKKFSKDSRVLSDEEIDDILFGS